MKRAITKKFEDICRLSAKGVKKYVKTELKNLGYENVFSEDGFVFAPGDIPVLLCAHMDTVHEHVPTRIYYTKNKQGKAVLSAAEGIGGDDRCGIYMVLNIAAKRKCSILFLEDEEIGLIGASKFTKSKLSSGLQYQYIMEFDRANSNDCVFYECDNQDFIDFIEKDGFYKEAYGSCSDISEIAPHLGCAAVNLSCGYYKQHTKSEYVIPAEMEASIKSAIKILDRTKPEDCFEYVEASWDTRWGVYDPYDWDEIYESMLKHDGKMHEYVICYDDGFGSKEDMFEAYSFAEAVGLFLMDNSGLTFGDIYDWYQSDYISEHNKQLSLLR